MSDSVTVTLCRCVFECDYDYVFMCCVRETDCVCWYVCECDYMSVTVSVCVSLCQTVSLCISVDVTASVSGCVIVSLCVCLLNVCGCDYDCLSDSDYECVLV